METIFKDVRAGFIASTVIGILSTMVWGIISLNIYLGVILGVFLETWIGYIFLKSINVDNKRAGENINLLLNFLLGLMHTIAVVSIFFSTANSIMEDGDDMGWIVVDPAVMVSSFLFILLLFWWVYALRIKTKDIFIGVLLAVISGYAGSALGYIGTVVGLSMWSGVLVWHLLMTPYFRNIFRRESMKNMTPEEARKRGRVVLIIISILLIVISITALIIYTPIFL